MRRSYLCISVFILMVILAACSLSNIGDPGEPPPNDLVRASIYIIEMQLYVMESYPVQVSLHLSGELPTPCHSFSYTIAEPNENLEIYIDAFSLVEDGAICIQVLQPFEENVSIPMVGRADGLYTVFVNGEKVGAFSYPG